MIIIKFLVHNMMCDPFKNIYFTVFTLLKIKYYFTMKFVTLAKIFTV